MERRLGMAAAAGVLLVLVAAGTAGAKIVPGGGVLSGVSEAALLVGIDTNSDEYLASKMVEWIQSRGRVPTSSELNRSETLRRQWDAYQRIRQRYADYQKYLQAWQKQADADRRKRLDEEAKREYQKALDLFADKRYVQAVEKFKDVLKNNDYSTYHGDAQTKLQEIDQMGQTELGEAKAKATAGQYDEAFKGYQAVMFKYRGTPSADAAGKEYNILQNSPEYKTTVKKARAADLAKRAEAEFAAKHYGNAAGLYEMLITGYSDLDEGRTAKTKLDAMKANEEIWAAVKKERAQTEAASLLSQAKMLINSGMKDKAEPRLRELIEKYPDTEAANEARELLGLPRVTTRPTTQPAEKTASN